VDILVGVGWKNRLEKYLDIVLDWLGELDVLCSVLLMQCTLLGSI
jgi:hypothetical protein